MVNAPHNMDMYLKNVKSVFLYIRTVIPNKTDEIKILRILLIFISASNQITSFVFVTQIFLQEEILAF